MNREPSSATNAPFFKEWAKPGPMPPASSPAMPVEENETLDAISGYYRLFQLRDGHRFSTDDILTAWYGTSWCPSAATVLDLGSGIGSVGIVAAWRLTGARFVTVEAQAESVALAKKSAAYNGLMDRYEIRLGDFRDASPLADHETFDLILGSPPYFPLGTGVTPGHPQKIACRFEMRGDISDYCKIAAAHLRLGGVFAAVFPFDQIGRVQQAACNAGLSIVRQRPVVFREGDAPLIGLFAMTLSAHLPPPFRGQTWTEPNLVIRLQNGQVHPEYSAIKLSIGFPP